MKTTKTHISTKGASVDLWATHVTVENANGDIFQIDENVDGSLNVRCITGTMAVRPVMTGRVEIVAL